MGAFRFDGLGQREHFDPLRLSNGQSATIRYAEPGDVLALQAYFRSLSVRSRYNRFLGAISELPRTELERFVHPGAGNRFSVIVTVAVDGREAILGEARYALDARNDAFEFGLSVDDRWQGHGIGSALLGNLKCRAASFGVTRLFGDTLRSNEIMIGLAKKSGFSLVRHPDDWRLVRFEKQIEFAAEAISFARVYTHEGADVGFGARQKSSA